MRIAADGHLHDWPTTCNVAAVESLDMVSIITSDISPVNHDGGYYLWVNHTVLSFFYIRDDSPIDSSPTSPFPFARPAAATVVDSTTFYLYHQINGSVLVEDIWDMATVSWSSSNISIRTS